MPTVYAHSTYELYNASYLVKNIWLTMFGPLDIQQSSKRLDIQP